MAGADSLLGKALGDKAGTLQFPKSRVRIFTGDRNKLPMDAVNEGKLASNL